MAGAMHARTFDSVTPRSNNERSDADPAHPGYRFVQARRKNTLDQFNPYWPQAGPSLFGTPIVPNYENSIKEMSGDKNQIGKEKFNNPFAVRVPNANPHYFEDPYMPELQFNRVNVGGKPQASIYGPPPYK